MNYEIAYGCVSHTGKVRRQNQDNFLCVDAMQHYDAAGTDEAIRGRIDTKKGVTFAVFDGMGGEQCGEMAAYIAAQTMREKVFTSDDAEELLGYCTEANRKICAYADTHEISTMGTTAAILRFKEDRILLCNIGDSRIFHLSGEFFHQISTDHVSVGMPGKKPPLSQSLGIPESEFLIEPYTACGKCKEGDRYLICSDGLTDMVSEERMAEILKDGDDAAVVDTLLREALENGGKDNITLILIGVKKQKPSLLNKIFRKKTP